MGGLIKDPYGRPVDNLRLSVTQECDLRCFFCHREGESRHAYSEMSPDEMERVVSVAASLGVGRVKLTGGEPLLRGDIAEVVRRLSSIPRIREVAVTTNGILLGGLAGPLRAAGLTRVNVSLPSLDVAVYRAVTGVDAVGMVRDGIVAAVEAGLSPVKVNMVMLRGLNDGEVEKMIDFTADSGLILQLIEFEAPSPDFAYYRDYHMDLGGLEEILGKRAEQVVVRRMHKRRKYFLKGGGEVEVVRPMHNATFCGNCSRLRVTSDGRFKPCLFRDDNTVDFLTPIRSGATDEAIKSMFLEAVSRRKPYFE